MKKELEILQFIETHLIQNKCVVLMVVAESSGSSPGRQGFKMAVTEDGTLFGSIGGGVMEVALVELAQGKSKKAKGKNNSKFQISNSKLVEQIHRKDVQNSSGMICSGKQTVIFKDLTNDNLETVQKIIKYLENQKSVALQISDSKFQTIENTQDNAMFYFEQKNENNFIYQEKIGFQNNLFIIGGGHCALALSELMSKMDFHISLFDDRPNLNTLEKNKFAHSKTIIESYENIGQFIESGKNNYVVVMTLGYKFDEIVIRQLFDKNFKYFGVLGSKSKMRTLFRNLESEGFDKNKLAKIRTPIGLPINSHTPEEIAVSIAAEIIAVKNKASGV